MNTINKMLNTIKMLVNITSPPFFKIMIGRGKQMTNYIRKLGTFVQSSYTFCPYRLVGLRSRLGYRPPADSALAAVPAAGLSH